MKKTIFILILSTILGQMGCKPDKKTAPTPPTTPQPPPVQEPWRAPDPSLKTGEEQLKLKDIKVTNQTSLTTADSIIFDIPENKSYLNIQIEVEAICVQNLSQQNSKLVKIHTFAFQPQLKLVELLPNELFYNETAKELNMTFCEFNFKAKNTDGSLHYFKLPLTEIKTSPDEVTIALKLNDRFLNTIETVHQSQLSQFWYHLPSTQQNVTLQLECENYRTFHINPGVQFNSFSGFDFQNFESKDVRFTHPYLQKNQQHCRLFLIKDSIIQHMSGYFLLQFPFHPIEVKEQWVFHQALFRNPGSHNIYRLNFTNPNPFKVKLSVPPPSLHLYITRQDRKYLMERPMIWNRALEFEMEPNGHYELYFGATLINYCDTAVGAFLHIPQVQLPVIEVVTGNNISNVSVFKTGYHWRPMNAGTFDSPPLPYEQIPLTPLFCPAK